jgi:hypothetical protein
VKNGGEMEMDVDSDSELLGELVDADDEEEEEGEEEGEESYGDAPGDEDIKKTTTLLAQAASAQHPASTSSPKSSPLNGPPPHTQPNDQQSLRSPFASPSQPAASAPSPPPAPVPSPSSPSTPRPVSLSDYSQDVKTDTLNYWVVVEGEGAAAAPRAAFRVELVVGSRAEGVSPAAFMDWAKRKVCEQGRGTALKVTAVLHYEMVVRRGAMGLRNGEAEEALLQHMRQQQIEESRKGAVLSVHQPFTAEEKAAAQAREEAGTEEYVDTLHSWLFDYNNPFTVLSERLQPVIASQASYPSSSRPERVLPPFQIHQCPHVFGAHLLAKRSNGKYADNGATAGECHARLDVIEESGLFGKDSEYAMAEVRFSSSSSSTVQRSLTMLPHPTPTFIFFHLPMQNLVGVYSCIAAFPPVQDVSDGGCKGGEIRNVERRRTGMEPEGKVLAEAEQVHGSGCLLRGPQSSIRSFIASLTQLPRSHSLHLAPLVHLEDSIHFVPSFQRSRLLLRRASRLAFASSLRAVRGDEHLRLQGRDSQLGPPRPRGINLESVRSRHLVVPRRRAPRSRSPRLLQPFPLPLLCRNFPHYDVSIRNLV